jgi:hypothetical protein
LIFSGVDSVRLFAGAKISWGGVRKRERKSGDEWFVSSWGYTLVLDALKGAAQCRRFSRFELSWSKLATRLFGVDWMIRETRRLVAALAAVTDTFSGGWISRVATGWDCSPLTPKAILLGLAIYCGAGSVCGGTGVSCCDRFPSPSCIVDGRKTDTGSPVGSGLSTHHR